MAQTRSMTRRRNHDAASSSSPSSSSSSRKRIVAFDKGGVAPWSDVNHDVLFLVMKKLGVVDFLALSGVCKSWRSFAVCNKKMFMASLPPMSMKISTDANGDKDSYCKFKDFEGRKFKTILPHLAGRICVGLTCGYLILFGRETHDFWLVNPITRHEIHFPDFPLYVGVLASEIKAILVFSPSISGWVLVVVHRKPWYHLPKSKTLFCVEGKRRWNHVSSTLATPGIIDLHYFKGKIYTIHIDSSLHELKLDAKLKCNRTLLEIKIVVKPGLAYPGLVSSGENLYMINQYSHLNKALELDFGKMNWVSSEKTIGVYAFYFSYFNGSFAIKPMSRGEPQTQITHHKSYDHFLDDDKSRKCLVFEKSMWYFPDNCLDVNLLDD